MSFLTFAENGRSASGKTKLFTVMSAAGGVLGWVSWYAPWRKYCAAVSSPDNIFDPTCLREIADFCEKQTKEHKA